MIGMRGMLGVGFVGFGLVIATAPAALGQSMGSASLGGYGAMAAEDAPSRPGARMPGGAYSPFDGRLGAPMATGMGGDRVAFRPRRSSMMAAPPARRPLAVGPMDAMRGGRGGFVLRGPVGAGRASSRSRMGTIGPAGVMPPSFGSPFRPPSSFPGGAGGPAGLGM